MMYARTKLRVGKDSDELPRCARISASGCKKSVFECQVDDMKFEELRRRLLREINDEEDNLRLYRLTEPRDEHVETYGLSRTVFFEDPLIA
jgi:CRISPR-associated endonuclease Cas2